MLCVCRPADAANASGHDFGSSELYDASITDEVESALLTAFETGRHGYVAPEFADLVEAIEIKEYEVCVYIAA